MRVLPRLEFLLVAALFLGSGAIATAAAPKVIASIVPVHALVAGVMDGVATPELLLSGQTSEHQASFSPLQVKALGAADVVFIIGAGLELKLGELSGSEAVKGKRFVELADIAGLTKFAIREGGAFESHSHAEGEIGHDDNPGKAAFDPHLWLDPGNAKVMVAAIAQELATADPANAATYDKNAKTMATKLDSLADEISAELSPVKNRPFIVHHDAYQYFERRFGLAAAGSISDFSASEPSAQRLKQVRDQVKSSGAVCVFHEPQFSGKAAQIMTEDTSARAGVLDPIGSTLRPGKAAYRELLLTLARDLKACLAG